ncbi:hypothetical protein LSUE1_G004411 [Lachnellula suecica]|uniref:F-box domain-containing protein n=1 Tax=Lachnellula suecica TaxID=602035 RepID=A0A8T9C6Y7_9HELO|nr:hypothetical protein LSUE1_G004411 [Lachnellula suecica]
MRSPRHVKSKPVASYMQRLSSGRPNVWSTPALLRTKTGFGSGIRGNFFDDEDGLDSDSSSDCIVVEQRSSQSAILIDDDDEDEPDFRDVAMEEPVDEIAHQGIETEQTATGESARLFKSIPVEIHQHIARYLPTARDISRYAQVCKSTDASITDSVWRERFECTFDKIPRATPQEVAKKYRFRVSVSGMWTCFDLGQHGAQITSEIRQVQGRNQNDCLEMLKTLIIESDARKVRDGNGNEIVDGLNMGYIRGMIANNNAPKFVDIISSILNTPGALDGMGGSHKIVTATKPGSLVYVVQLALTPISLHPDHCNFKVAHFDISQAQVYATSKAQPIFVGKVKQDINVRWLLHTVNFFKFHFKSGASEGIISDEYAALEHDQYPQPWIGLIKAGTQPLGRFWKGAHTFMDERDLVTFRQHLGPGRIYSDATYPGDSFPDMEMFFDEQKFPSSAWPSVWEGLLRSNPFFDMNAPPVDTSNRRASPRKGRAVPASKQPPILTFYGLVRGSKPAHFYGRLHALPQQQGLHGFQRLVLMKFYTDPNGGFDMSQIFCYEGCVLPGGRVIVGRWWDALADPKAQSTASGPFIWWNVDRSAAGITDDMEAGGNDNSVSPGDQTLTFFEEAPKYIQ